MKYADDAVMEMFMKTGDPFYFVARNVLRERRENGGECKNTGDSPQ